MAAPVLVALAIAASTSQAVGAGLGMVSRGCPADITATPRTTAIAANVHLSTTLDARGAVTGRSLSLSTAAGPRTITLATESFVSEPVSNFVVFGEATPTGSIVSGIDLQTGCAFRLRSSQDVARSAVIDRQLRNLFVHSVSPATRADLGITRIDLATRAATLVVPAPPASEEFGPTFATVLRWSAEGDALAVQSCGMAACRTRVLDTTAGTIQSYARMGEIVGLDGSSIRAYDACAAWPCAVITIDRHSGERTKP
jgi:hypothetical protein